MTFKVAFGLAVAMVLLAAVNHRLSAGYFALVLLYLLLASFLPWLMVPLGVVVIIAQLVSQDSQVASWLGSFKP